MTSIRTRRDFLRTAAYIGAAAPLLSRAAETSSSWDEMGRILARVKAPVFPERDFDITRYGARDNKSFDSSDALSRAIADCSQKGGGRVVVPAGTFLTAAVTMRSNVNLHLARGATLLFVQDTKRYPVVSTRFEGVELMNYSPFIYGVGAENIAITGEGTLDGNADDAHWWPWKGKKEFGWKPGDPKDDARQKLFEMGEKELPLAQRVFGDGGYLRPNFIQPRNCRNVLIEGVTILRSPMWEITPWNCTNLIVRNVNVDSHGPNNDGCDPDSCRDVLIENCTFSTGDDCIAIKAGRNRDGRRLGLPTENVVIRNCTMKDGHGGVTIGSEMSGGVRNVFVENCKLSSPNLNQALRFKTNAMRGGTIENIYIRNIEVGEVSDAVIQVDFYYEEGLKGPEKPIVRNINVENLTAHKAKYALFLKAFPEDPMRDFHLRNCTISGVAKDNVIEHVEGLTMDEVRIIRA